MLFVELLVPKGVFDERERRRLAGRLTGRHLLAAAGGSVAPDVVDLLDELTHVVVREEEVWNAGGHLLDAAQGPRYIVNVIAGMWGSEMSDYLISRITTELGEAEGNPEPKAVVHVISLPEGAYGLYGRAQGPSDVRNLMDRAVRSARGEARARPYAFVIETKDNQERRWSWIVDFGDVVGRGVADELRGSPEDFARAALDSYLHRLVERAPGAAEFFLHEDEHDTQWRVQVWDIRATGYDQICGVPPAGDLARRQYPLTLRAERIAPQVIVTVTGEVVRNTLRAKHAAQQRARRVMTCKPVGPSH